MCIYIYIYVCVCVCLLYMFICICVCVFVCIYIFVCAYAYIFFIVCMYSSCADNKNCPVHGNCPDLLLTLKENPNLNNKILLSFFGEEYFIHFHKESIFYLRGSKIFVFVCI